MGGVELKTRGYFPRKFFNKEVNEPFVKWVLSKSFLAEKEWISGNADKGEPDYFYDGIPFEFTLACDEAVHDTFIMRLRSGKYSSNDLEKDICEYIQTSINKKANKNYSVGGIHLVVIIPIDMFSWVSDYYGSVTHYIFDYRRKEFFEKLRIKYIQNEVFNNIFIVFPDIALKWWVYDVKTENRAFAFLTNEEIESGNYPYIEVEKDDLSEKGV